MTEVAYNDQDRVLFWSWMAYSGGIKFVKIELGNVCWNDDLKFDEECKYVLVTKLGDFSDCTMKPDRKQHAILASSRRNKGWIQYDVEDSGDISQEQCVVVGRMWKKNIKKYCVLVVRPTNVDSEYKKVGVELIQSGCILRRETNVRVV